MKHQHKCGYVLGEPCPPLGEFPGEPDPSTGCGHVWEHDVDSDLPAPEYYGAHNCPKCGKGPWISKYWGEGTR